ncbi:LysR substrate-binding domain-containing protein [Sphingomonas sp.]|uniref:LysR family transcriptional regulator n=1 Tax=Sphingomonas sp. TaxID=28214 RepID=UPI0025F81CBF|nr:LysR substrate-binding domain-containing protein [Sphingomonas sp.]
MRLNDRQIEAFRATVALRSMSAAARQLCVTQPAISHLVADLEIEIGFPLFERVGRGVRPTRRAQLLYDEIERVYLGMAAVRERAIMLRDMRFGQLRVAAMPAFAETIVAPALGRYLAANPNTGIEFDVLNTSAIIDGVRRRRFDLGIAVPIHADAAIAWRSLRSTPMVAVMPHDHLLAQRPAIETADLADHDVIALPPDSPYRLKLQNALAQARPVPLRVLATVRTQLAACEMMLSGCKAITIVDQAIAARYRRSLAIRPLAFELMSEVAICTLVAEPVPDEAFCDLLRQQAEKTSIDLPGI